MEVRCLKVGQLETNCYLVWDETTLECFIIDPGEDADFITTEIISLKLHPQAILLTHGHFDHCLACLELKLNFNIPIFLDPKDNFLYQNAAKSAEHWTATKALELPPPTPFENSKIENFFTVIPTPGHTPGSVCLLVNEKCKMKNVKYLFVGDLIFEDGVGRTDFSYSSPSDLKSSLSKLNSLFLIHNSSLLIYSGHGNSSFSLSDLDLQ
jgi:hydroxyacylglutathione hydrolase